MARFIVPLTLLLALLATACARSSPPNTGAAVNAAPSTGAPGAETTSWTRPMDVSPLREPFAAADSAGGKVAAGEGAFDVISDTPWPGAKVRVFFFGTQG